MTGASGRGSAPVAQLRALVAEAAAGVAGAQAGARPVRAPILERPPRPDFGDYSSNAALMLAPAVSVSPRELAGRVGEELMRRMGAALDRVDVAGPGFVNLHLADRWFVQALAGVLATQGAFGGGGVAAHERERIDVEFVSANPTGPLTVASGRHAAFGDALARILAFDGHDVHREYYVNDHGSQVARLGESIRAHARGEPVPEDGYRGEYVAELVDGAGAREMEVAELADAGVDALLERIRVTLDRFGVTFDTWFRESSLHEVDGANSPVDHAIAALEEAGMVYESEGALWLRTTQAGDDKDRVLRRSDGQHTYFASDIANHQQKLQRGFDRLIDVWGADHHGYFRRLQTALQALGSRPEAFEVVILQFVHLIERGERASMSKRRGEFVTLDDLIGEIGVDAARYFLLTRAPETTVDLDLDLARDHSNENPVYYIQYAHARIHSVLQRSGSERVAEALAEVQTGAKANQSPTLDGAERALVKKVLAFPEEVAEAAARRAPHRIAAYALELAQEFTAFYRDCRVVGAQPAALESFRLGCSEATRRTIATALGLLGVSAPDAM